MTIFEEFANILYFYSVISCDRVFLENRLLEIHEINIVFFDGILSALLSHFPDVQDLFSAEFCALYIDKFEDL